MSFNENIRTNPGRARSGGRGAAVVGGTSVLGLLLAFAVYQFTGVDVTPLLEQQPQPASQSQQQENAFAHCTDGKAANEYDDCRMIATMESLDALWSQQLPVQGQAEYSQPGLVLFEQAVNTGCGQATSAVGPFYCPQDATIYMDTTFFSLLRSQFGASAGPLAQSYVLAHETGHHIQNILGVFQRHNTQEKGEQGGGVRSELQADCYAGVWMHCASKTVDPESGETFLKPPTDAQIRDALNAAEAIGDDRIQATQVGQVRPDTWTHGSSEQRMHWLKLGFESGSLAQCDTFAAERV
ncbi:MAG: neutral zinc metallopeptidase [Actinomycetaceae bacterium]|nr:neutral zinc metallopeptidase [Actinomycetaceae bacterium]